jgi:rhodanese-related sulfurtransferase
MPTTQNIFEVSANEAFDVIQNNRDNPDFMIIDVRTPQEYADGHIEQAINFDFNSDNFRGEINKLDRNKIYLIYCRSGNRSRGALGVMKELNFMNVYHMYDGIMGWTNNGYPIAK